MGKGDDLRKFRWLPYKEVISEIAKTHGNSSAQVILRWNLQKGVLVIPASSNPDPIQEITELFDFELAENEMERLTVMKNMIGINCK